MSFDVGRWFARRLSVAGRLRARSRGEPAGARGASRVDRAAALRSRRDGVWGNPRSDRRPRRRSTADAAPTPQGVRDRARDSLLKTYVNPVFDARFENTPKPSNDARRRRRRAPRARPRSPARGKALRARRGAGPAFVSIYTDEAASAAEKANDPRTREPTIAVRVPARGVRSAATEALRAIGALLHRACVCWRSAVFGRPPFAAPRAAARVREHARCATDVFGLRRCRRRNAFGAGGLARRRVPEHIEATERGVVSTALDHASCSSPPSPSTSTRSSSDPDAPIAALAVRRRAPAHLQPRRPASFVTEHTRLEGS